MIKPRFLTPSEFLLCAAESTCRLDCQVAFQINLLTSHNWPTWFFCALICLTTCNNFKTSCLDFDWVFINLKSFGPDNMKCLQNIYSKDRLECLLSGKRPRDWPVWGLGVHLLLANHTWRNIFSRICLSIVSFYDMNDPQGNAIQKGGRGSKPAWTHMSFFKFDTWHIQFKPAMRMTRAACWKLN